MMRAFSNWFNINTKLEIKPYILMYHRIIDTIQYSPFPVQPGMYVSISNFEENVVYLKKNFNIVRLEELLDIIFQGHSLKNHCAITFDDGWEDNYENALPILIKHNVPAAFFLTTALIGTENWFWFDEIAYFMGKSSIKVQLEVFARNTVPNNIIKAISKKNDTIQNKITKVVYEIKNSIDVSDRKKLMLDICSLNRQYGQSTKIMLDWNQVKLMKTSGLADFYSHSHTHENLDQCTKQFVAEDITKSLEQLSSHVQQSGSRIFCYPSGKCNEITASVLKDLGFKYAVTTERGFVDKNDTYNIKRIGIHNDISRKLIKSLR